jgi:AcrR family transcriptional regulator
VLIRALDAEGEPDEYVERILDAALKTFEGFGFRRTTMEDVARAAGISRVTIYRRFAGKDSLTEAVILREARRFFEALDVAVGQRDTFEDRAAESFVFALEFLRAHLLFNRLVTTEPESLVPHLTTLGGPAIAAASRLVAERLDVEVRAGRLPPLDVEATGEIIVRLVLSFILTPTSVNPLDRPDDVRRFARRFVAPALIGTPPEGAAKRRPRAGR